MNANAASPRKVLPFYTANWLIYSLNALYYSFMPLYIKSIGFSDANIGILLSIGPFISIVSPMIWGNLCDRAKVKNNILILILSASAICFFAVSFHNSFGWIFTLFAVLMFFMAPYGGLIDTLTLEYTSQNNIAYGPIRLMGTLGFGLIALAVDFIAGYYFLGINSIFYVYILCALLSILSVRFMAPIKGHGSVKGVKTSPLPLFKDKTLITMLVLIAITQFAFGYYLNFYPIYLKQTLGAPNGIWGLIVLVTVVGEIPFFIFFDKLFKKLGIKKLIILTMVLIALRGPGLGWITNIPGILITSLLTGLSPTIITYCAAVYISSTVKPELRAVGQNLIYSLGWSVPRAIAGIAGGYLTQGLGVPNSMLICTVISIIALIAMPFLPIPKYHKQA